MQNHLAYVLENYLTPCVPLMSYDHLLLIGLDSNSVDKILNYKKTADKEEREIEKTTKTHKTTKTIHPRTSSLVKMRPRTLKMFVRT